ncbi:MAG: phage head closure protein, partial [Sulfuricaulis sp.]|nr:phage head closure protein [Sulfuricaulis sp.]
LDRKIRIEKRVVSQQDYGEPVPTYTLLAEVWADVRPLSGREFFDAEQTIAEDFTEFRTRWIEGVNAQCRILYDGNEYNVRAVHELGRRAGLRIVTTVTNP